MGHAVGGEPQLVEIPRAQLERRAQPERVVLPTALPERDETHVHILIHVPAVVPQQAGPTVPADDDQVEVAVLVEVGDGDRPASPQAVGQNGRKVFEAPRRVVTEQEHAPPARRRGFTYYDQIEPPVVVEVENGGVKARDARELAPQRARLGVQLERAVPAILVQCGLSPVESGHEQVEETVVVVVA